MNSIISHVATNQPVSDFDIFHEKKKVEVGDALRSLIYSERFSVVPKIHYIIIRYNLHKKSLSVFSLYQIKM